jgi:hypothetical protein
MKAFFTVCFAIACVGYSRGQGTVALINRVPGTVITHVYLGGDHQIVGNGSNDYSDTSMTPGTVDWSGYTGLLGSNYMAQLLAAPGMNQPESTLLPSLTVATFRQTTNLLAAGFVNNVLAHLSNVAPDAPVATVELVAWDNSSGLYPTWTQAEVAWEAGSIAAGKGGAFNVYEIGGVTNIYPYLVGLQSFNIFVVPEPTTLALLGLGGAAMLVLRRRS